ncbi:hypothetical protein SAY87_009139 [Trapa incisa]|uniref:Uncharacterized protein n=1 Tax=Trapa incisa TaxID=236973 RepID=A0AAN7JY96_9MYRT|nr:hypothetical protein SAY87_009139 [Trapa incisa]
MDRLSLLCTFHMARSMYMSLVYRCNRLLVANDLLVSEHVMLQQKLADMREAIFLQQQGHLSISDVGTFYL